MVASTINPTKPSITKPSSNHTHISKSHLFHSPSSSSNEKHKTNKAQTNNVVQNPRKQPMSKSAVPCRYLSPSPSSSSSNSTTTTSTSTSSSSSSFSSSRRFGSPLVSRSTNCANLGPNAPKRALSVDRRRPGTPRSTTPNAGDISVSSAVKMLVTSTRSLSVSFQGEAFSLPISKAKVAPSSSVNATTNNNASVVVSPSSNCRKPTPEKRKTTPLKNQSQCQGQIENMKVLDQHRWPGRSRDSNKNVHFNQIQNQNPSLTRSLDWASSNDSIRISDNSKNVMNRLGSGCIVRTLHESVIDEGRRMSFDGRLSLDLGSVEFAGGDRIRHADDNSANESSLLPDPTPDDTDSVSSGSTASGGGVVGFGLSKSKGGSIGIAGSAKFWQETNSRLRRLQDPGSPSVMSPGSRIGAAVSKFVQSKRFSTDSPARSPRTIASPVRGATRAASPSKPWTSSSFASPIRGMQSPSRVGQNSGGLGSSCSNGPSILSFSVDIRRGKIGEDRIVDAHLLRLLYNRYLQWRFVNARADATLMLQSLNAEKNLWNAWITTSELRHSITLKRIKLLLLRQKLKLTSIMKGQLPYLEEWSLLETDHASSLLGATEALRASTLRLPMVGKATADPQNLKDAIGSAVDVMQAMAASVCSLSPKVDEMNSLVAELVNVIGKEQVSLEQCKDFLSIVAAVQVKDCSLRAHILQQNRVPISSSLTTRV